jgi:hypothetical protein
MLFKKRTDGNKIKLTWRASKICHLILTTTPAGFDLTTHSSSREDDTTRPEQNMSSFFKFLAFMQKAENDRLETKSPFS